MHSKVDAFIAKEKKWQEAFEQLRTLLLDCGLTEALKWGTPCYSYNGKNIVLIHGFKEYCALLFFKGALLKDNNKILVQQTVNVQATRQVRFTHVKEIAKLKTALKAYVYEAIEIEKAGLKVDFKKTAAFHMPDELKKKFSKNKALKKAFDALTPGRQRGYLLHFAGAKQAATREARIDKYTAKILAGKGLTD